MSEEDSVPCDELSKEPWEAWQDAGGLIAQKVTLVNHTVSCGCVSQMQMPGRFMSCLQKRLTFHSAVF